MTSTTTPVAGMTSLPAAGTTWQADGLCRQTDPEVFFPGPGVSAAPAKRICTACESRIACLEYALAHDEHGVWGATTGNQRRAILRARRHEELAPVTEFVADKAERDQAILQLTKRGESAAEIASRLGCATRTVTRVRVAASREAAA